MIRRTSNGRLQITLARDGHMTAEIEADFLARLQGDREFQRLGAGDRLRARSLYDRYRKWAAFARDLRRGARTPLRSSSTSPWSRTRTRCSAARVRPPTPANDNEPAEEVPFDPVTAMRILSLHRPAPRRADGARAAQGAAGAPVRGGVRLVLAKIEAIERHEKMMKKRGGRAANSLPLDGGG